MTDTATASDTASDTVTSNTVLARVHPKALAAAQLFVAKNDVRFYLQGIAIQPALDTGAIIVATNGHLLIAIHDPNGTCKNNIIVQIPPTSITQCRNIYSGAIAEISQGEEEKSLLFKLPHSKNNILSSAKLIEGRFPDWRAIVPSQFPEGNKISSVLAATYLSILCAAAQILQKEKSIATLSLAAADPLSTSCVCFQPGIDDLTARAIIMPRRDTFMLWQNV